MTAAKHQTEGQKRKKRRLAAGIPQAALARTIGVDRVTLWRWEESGHTPIPALDRLWERALAQAEARVERMKEQANAE